MGQRNRYFSLEAILAHCAPLIVRVEVSMKLFSDSRLKIVHISYGQFSSYMVKVAEIVADHDVLLSRSRQQV